MAKKQERKNNVPKIICIVLALVAIAAVVVAVVNVGNSPSEPSEDKASDTGDQVDYSVLIDMDSQSVIDMMKNKDGGFLYVGRPTCPHCKIFAPILTKMVKQDDIDVYYYDTDVANSNSELKTEALELIEVTGVPAFMFIKDGEVVARISDTESEAVLKEFIQTYQSW
ncbi:MAG: thioredoxin family protein [Candidatus Nomurabacteria bacterium]|jgi:predicted bacteriocin transport accessory protein|nr:thioredoxin family protein [Candidatus Nomurabacteria bacterium]